MRYELTKEEAAIIDAHREAMRRGLDAERNQALVDVGNVLTWLKMTPPIKHDRLFSGVLTEFQRASSTLPEESVIRKHLEFYADLSKHKQED